jgi:tetratricopeptide (TPR) repeat protein
MLAVSAGIFVLMRLAPPAVVEAAMLDRRLRASTRHLPLSAEEVAITEDSLRIGQQRQVRIPETTVIQVREAIKVSALQKPALPNIAGAADALKDYERTNKLGAPTAASLAFIEGGEQMQSALRDYPSRIDESELNVAVATLTRAIALAGGNKPLRIEALMERARAYNFLQEPNEALADAEEAYRLGALDLASIASIESTALVTRSRPEDLRRAIDLITISIQLNPPEWLLSIDPAKKIEYQVEQLARRAIAFYRLGEFTKAIEDCRRALDLTPGLTPRPYPDEISSLFRTMILSYLREGNGEDARKAAAQWLQLANGNPAVNAVYVIVNSNRADPQRALAQLKQEFKWQ